jgi:serine/threonine protein kinase
LVKKLLQKKPEKRISACDAMGHNWLKVNTECVVIDEEIRCDALKELSSFRGKLKMQ